MLIPTKFTRLEESTIFKMKCILAEKMENESVLDAYFRTQSSFSDASEFLHAMDILFVLDIIDVDGESEVIRYA
ncbi:hypothetical protein E2553_46150 [Paraburkholderia dipogonis]|uniref:Uncharacterized protein n=2 Tax=Paraburkholderia dipogonis TaxID=1211383 RepID=A0A4Y8MHT6_9BURK|nr:hypothetical protein E2553_46150 [Paraburkholderia dipogonis]